MASARSTSPSSRRPADECRHRRVLQRQSRPQRPVAAGLPREVREVAQSEAVAGGGAVAGVVEVGVGHGADRLQQAVPRLALAPVDGDERAVDERPDVLGDVGRVDLTVAGGGRRGGDVEAADERGQAPQHGPLARGQHVVAPVEQRPQRPLPLGRAVVARPQRGRAGAQVGQQLGRGHHVDAGRGQLDRQRHPVEPAPDLRDQPVRLGSVEGGAGVAPTGPLDEELDAGLGDRQRFEGERLLAGDAEALPAGGEEADAGARGEHPRDELTGAVEHVLAVVQHDQRVAGPQVLDHDVEGVVVAEPCTQCVGDGGEHGAPGGDAREVDDPAAVGPVAGVGDGELEHQPGLAHPAGADDGDEPAPGPRRRRGPPVRRRDRRRRRRAARRCGGTRAPPAAPGTVRAPGPAR